MRDNQIQVVERARGRPVTKAPAIAIEPRQAATPPERLAYRVDDLAQAFGVHRRTIERVLAAGIITKLFRATGTAVYLLNAGLLEYAQQIAAHESPRTTKLYDRTGDEIALDEVERISI